MRCTSPRLVLLTLHHYASYNHSRSPVIRRGSGGTALLLTPCMAEVSSRLSQWRTQRVRPYGRLLFRLEFIFATNQSANCDLKWPDMPENHFENVKGPIFRSVCQESGL